MVKDIVRGEPPRTLHVVFDWFGALGERVSALR